MAEQKLVKVSLVGHHLATMEAELVLAVPMAAPPLFPTVL
jgi:hypothetical protein